MANDAKGSNVSGIVGAKRGRFRRELGWTMGAGKKRVEGGDEGVLEAANECESKGKIGVGIWSEDRASIDLGVYGLKR